MTNRLRNQPNRRWILGTAVAMAALCSTAAWAGEVKVGATELAVDDKGNLTAEGRKAIVDTLDEVPGEDLWKAYIWAKLDNAAEGPLYIEFYQNLNGSDSLVWRYEESNFNGGKYYSAEIELAGGRGFNKDRTYEIKAVQVSPKNKDITLATGKLKLIKSGKKPPKDPDEGKKTKEEEEQDARDSLAEDDKSSDEPKPTEEAPPPVEPKAKKGCTVDSDSSAWNGTLLLLVVGAGVAARRRRAA